MKIIQVVQHLAPGGIETMVLELQRIYQERDEVIILSLEGHYQHNVRSWSRLYGLNCELIFMNKSQGTQPGLIWQLVQLFKQLKPDVVHTHHIGPLFYAGTAARWAKINSIVHTEHDGWHLQQSKKRQLIQQGLLKMVRPHLVADAEHVGEVLSGLYPQQKLHVIPNGIDTQRFVPGAHIKARQQLNLPHNKLLIGCAARLVQGKGHHYLLEAMQQLPQNLHLALAGDGPLKNELMAEARVLGILERVHFLGNLESMTDFYHAIDLFCLPSEAEGLPLSPLEAQACGVPVLITDTGGCKEAVCNKTGLLVPSKDSKALAQGVLELLQRFCISEMQSPREYVLQHHDLKKVARQYRRLMVKHSS
ncbi:Glycosyltransferase involved in cell wall bisynthesis [Oceanospirillum multiglobuliferum]|uniref:Glycosyl transferase n=1 Tax=Oceanospirillum multiglobuliferum TaxID=64969 RepID=A0A1T4PTS2_9GAMM|nr:glycosyltransferase [Oceanospirillum multiglobuliferum]OPX55330.1 hypothetical protein BTE48_09180 [Oceanospirillum multiglobuliferum]SJZ94701.1 Glycosyltransferase involved in cell wall bisynthesis [Oceanospirillum multiglobuliferum]